MSSKYYVVIPGFTYKNTGPLQIDAIKLEVTGTRQSSYLTYTNDLKYMPETGIDESLNTNNIVYRIETTDSVSKRYAALTDATDQARRFPYDCFIEEDKIFAPFGYYIDTVENDQHTLSICPDIKYCEVQSTKHHDGLFFIGIDDLSDYLTLKFTFYVKLPVWQNDSYVVKNYTETDTPNLNDFAEIFTKTINYRPLGSTLELNGVTKVNAQNQYYDLTLEENSPFDFKLDFCLVNGTDGTDLNTILKYDANSHKYKSNWTDDVFKYDMNQINTPGSSIYDALMVYSYPQWALFHHGDKFKGKWCALPIVCDSDAIIVSAKKYGGENGNFPLLLNDSKICSPDKYSWGWHGDTEVLVKKLKAAAKTQREWLKDEKGPLGYTAEELQLMGILATNINAANNANGFGPVSDADFNDDFIFGFGNSQDYSARQAGLAEDIYRSNGALSFTNNYESGKNTQSYDLHFGNTKDEFVSKYSHINTDKNHLVFSPRILARLFGKNYHSNTTLKTYRTMIGKTTWPFQDYYKNFERVRRAEFNVYDPQFAPLDILARRLNATHSVWPIALQTFGEDHYSHSEIKCRDVWFCQDGVLYSYTPVFDKKGTICYLYKIPLQLFAKNYGGGRNRLCTVSSKDRKNKTFYLPLFDEKNGYTLHQSMDTVQNPYPENKDKSLFVLDNEEKLLMQDPAIGYGIAEVFTIGNFTEEILKKFFQIIINSGGDINFYKKVAALVMGELVARGYKNTNAVPGEISSFLLNFIVSLAVGIPANIGSFFYLPASLAILFQLLVNHINGSITYYANNSRILVDANYSPGLQHDTDVSDYSVHPMMYWRDEENDMFCGLWDDKTTQGGVTITGITTDISTNYLISSGMGSGESNDIDFNEINNAVYLVDQNITKMDWLRQGTRNEYRTLPATKYISPRSMAEVGKYYEIPTESRYMTVGTFNNILLTPGLYIFNANVAGEHVLGEKLIIDNKSFSRSYTDPDKNSNIVIYVKTEKVVNIVYQIITDSIILGTNSVDLKPFTGGIPAVFSKSVPLTTGVDLALTGKTNYVQFRNCGLYKYQANSTNNVDAFYQIQKELYLSELHDDIDEVTNTDFKNCIILPSCLTFDDYGECYDKEYLFSYLPPQPWLNMIGRYKVKVPQKFASRSLEEVLSQQTSLVSKINPSSSGLVEDQFEKRFDGELSYFRNSEEEKVLKNILTNIRK